MEVLRVHNVSKTFGSGHTAVQALRHVHLHAVPGDIILIMGPSGSGKTTLLSIAGGILKPTEGKVSLKGTTITELDERDLPRVRIENIGFIFQSFNLIASLTALENVELAANLAGIKDEEASKRAKKVLMDLGLGHRLHTIPANLSGGEKQRVAIARALVNNPDIILADEPTA